MTINKTRGKWDSRRGRGRGNLGILFIGMVVIGVGAPGSARGERPESKPEPKPELSIVEPFVLRKAADGGGGWVEFDPEAEPPVRGEYVRLGFRFLVGAPMDDIVRKHELRNRNGKEYERKIEYRGVSRDAGVHRSYFTYKIPGDAPEQLEYKGEVKAKGTGAKKFSMRFPVVGERRRLGIDVHDVWIAPRHGEGDVDERIERPLVPGEIVRLVVEFYAERKYEKSGDKVRLRYSCSDIEYEPEYLKALGRPGFHTTYRRFMVPTEEIGDWRPLDEPFENRFAVHVIPQSGDDDSDFSHIAFASVPAIAPEIDDPRAPGLYVSKESPDVFFGKRGGYDQGQGSPPLKSGQSFRAGESIYLYMIWKRDYPTLPADMVLEKHFVVPELEFDVIRGPRWHQRVGYSYRRIRIPADTRPGTARFQGSIIAYGGTGNVIDGEAVSFEIKEPVTHGESKGSGESIHQSGGRSEAPDNGKEKKNRP